MNFRRQIALANFVVMVAVAFAWLAGANGAAFTAIGTATFGFASLWPQYTHERGVWMAGGLVMMLTAFAMFIGLMDLFTGSIPGETPRSLYGTVLIGIGIVVLSLFLAFTIYATFVNFRLSRRLMTFVDNTHKQNGEPSDATASR
jgi:hypothetical protein